MTDSSKQSNEATGGRRDSAAAPQPQSAPQEGQPRKQGHPGPQGQPHQQGQPEPQGQSRLQTGPRPRSNPGSRGGVAPRDPTADATRTEGLDPGAFIGRKPERQAQTIPGGVGRRDERVSAAASRAGPAAGLEAAPGGTSQSPPAGHRQPATATSDTKREAGQDH